MIDTILPMGGRRSPSGNSGVPPVVAVLVFEHAASFEVGVAEEVFGVVRDEVVGRSGVPVWYDYRLCGVKHGVRWQGPGGSTVHLAYGLETVAAADVVIVPSCPKLTDSLGVATGARSPTPGTASSDVVDAVRACHDRGGTVMSFCSGAFVLAQTGLLDGQRATTHWMYGDAFRRRFPQVRLIDDVLYVDNGRVLTSAGTAAAIDLSVHYVRREHGAHVAGLIARRMVVPPHRDGGQAQYATASIPDVDEQPLADLLEWMVRHLDRRLTVEQLAARVATSPRSFARHFRAATGTTPHQWLTARRVDHARRLLETTNLPIERIAQSSGLGSAANLRARFSRTLGVAPTTYRRHFRRDDP
jgi:AraC family transcriptional activator FtrA